LNKAYDIITTLTPGEISRLSKAKWSPREKELLNAMLKVALSKRKLPAVTAATLKISPSHFDKLCSLVTEKIFQALTSGNFTGVIAFLLQKALSKVLLHELGIQHRKVKAGKNAALQKEFYLTAFETIRKMSFDVLDLKALRYYADRLKPFLKDNAPFSSRVLQYRFVYIENAFHFLNGKGLPYGPKALKNIQAVWSKPDERKDPAAYAHYQICMALYTKDFIDNQDMALGHAQKCLQCSKQWAPGVDDAFLASSYGMVATIHSHRSEFNQAMAVYMEAFERLPQQMQGSYYQIFMLACVAMVCGDFELLEQHMDKHIKKFLDSNAGLYYRVESTRLYALLYLYQRKFDKALELIRELQKTKRKEITDTADVFLRMIDNLYFLVTADYHQAITQSKKNLKFLKRKKYTFDNCDYNHLFYTIALLAKMKIKNKVNQAALEPHYSRSQRGFMKMYGGLMEQVLNS
jgi:tetratricopeptide (TPR) repeat protein